MALKDYERDMEGCSRCSSCKWVPFNQIKSWRFAKNCPSICKYNFHAYSGSGRMIIALSLLQGRSELNDEVAEIIFKCQMCGACDTACKVYRDDIDISEVLLELRAHCVEQGGNGHLLVLQFAEVVRFQQYFVDPVGTWPCLLAQALRHDFINHSSTSMGSCRGHSA